jgi:hypothetical protein
VFIVAESSYKSFNGIPEAVERGVFEEEGYEVDVGKGGRE